MRKSNNRAAGRARHVLAPGLLILSSTLLAGCLEETDGARRTATQARPVNTIDQIDRSHKSDRLTASVKQAERSLEDARAAALAALQADTPLGKFYRALTELQTGMRQEPVTVLHLGDSHIAADNFSGDLREMLQARFGDAGRGMMMPGYPFPYYKARGVKFSRKGTWKASNSFEGDEGPYGLSGVRVTASKPGTRLSVRSDTGAFEWAEVAFLAQPDGGKAAVRFGGYEQEVDTASKSTEIRRVRLDSKGRKLDVETASKSPVSLLSVSVGQNRPGLRYVNFGIPGASADTPSRWDDALVAEQVKRLNPDLVILGYGTNEGFNDRLEGDAYEQRYTRLFGKLKGHAPSASFLVIGPPDGARLPRFARAKTREANTAKPCRALDASELNAYAKLKAGKSSKLARWHAPPNLGVVRQRLQKVASSQNALFWDWSSVMNGPCGIHAWAQADPPLAASDHVHLRSAGARRSAEALFKVLMSGYVAHVKLASR